MKTVVLILLTVYRYTFGPLLHAAVPAKSHCRFSPTCSEYMAVAIRTDGVVSGLSRGVARLSRCHS